MTVHGSSARKAEHIAPPIDGDFYRIADLLDPKERIVAQRLNSKSGVTGITSSVVIRSLHWQL